MNRAGLRHALAAWTAALGEPYVSSERQATGAASRATFPTRAEVAAILRPGSRAELQECVRIANRHRVPVYPISTGRNWGYGSRAPVADAVLLDLSRLDRITGFSEELAYVTVEPGVTQRQLQQFLEARGSTLWMDATGSSPDCSIIGNVMERGFGHTPLGDHCSHVCGFEVVLATGELIETGFRRFAGAKAAATSRWGTGPALDGLFTQSNLGIVTSMTVWLMPAPERFETFVLRSDAPISDIVDALRPLRMNGCLRSVVHIGNDYKILSGSGEYPWQETHGETPLSAEVMARLRQERGIARWSGSGALYGTRAQVRDARSRLKRALRHRVRSLQFVNARRLRLLRAIAYPYRLLTGRSDLQRALDMLAPLMDLQRGVPTDRFLGSSYWRKKTARPERPDPDADECGLLWCSPAIPLVGAEVETATTLAVELTLRHGFEPIISVSLLNERLAIATIALTYDRSVPGEDDRAVRCYHDLTATLLARGYPPYRLNVAAMEYGRGQGGYPAALSAIKAALDPAGILAPGRYQP